MGLEVVLASRLRFSSVPDVFFSFFCVVFTTLDPSYIAVVKFVNVIVQFLNPTSTLFTEHRIVPGFSALHLPSVVLPYAEPLSTQSKRSQLTVAHILNIWRFPNAKETGSYPL